MDCNTNQAECQAPEITLEGLAKMDAKVLTPKIVALVLGVHPNSICTTARTEKGRQELGFPVARIGTRTLIPRIPFLRFMGWEGKITGSKEDAA